MKNVVSAVHSHETGKIMSTADTINHEGALAWNMSNNSRLEQICMTGVFGNSFYVGNDELVSEAIQIFENADAENLARCITKGRNEGYVRAANILGLVYLSKKNSELFRKTFNDVVQTGNDMEDFISLLKTQRGFGDSIKKAMRGWIKEKTTPYYAVKYRKQIADAIRLSHFKCDLDPIFDFILGRYYMSITENRIGAALDKYPQLKAYADASDALKTGDSVKASRLIEEHRLDIQSLLGIGEVEDSVWKSIAKVMPVMASLKYLNKFDKCGVFGVENNIKDKFTVENFKKAKVFPIRLYTAYKNITNKEMKDHLSKVLDEYVGEYDWGIWKGKWCLAPDVSASMTSDVRCDTSCNNRSVVPAEISGMFCGILYKGIEDSVLVPWDTSVYPYDNPKSYPVIQHIKAISSCGGGGTCMQISLKHLIKNKIKVDYFLGITDNESWRNHEFLPTWIEYKRLNPKAKAFLIRCDAYNTQPFPDASAEKYGICQIFGWNDNVLKYIEAKLKQQEIAR